MNDENFVATQCHFTITTVNPSPFASDLLPIDGSLSTNLQKTDNDTESLSD